MREHGVIPVVVESPAGRADLVVDATLTLATLLPALLAATGPPRAGLSRSAGSSAAGGRWQMWDGQRRLDMSMSLLASGVLAGSELRIAAG